MLRVSVSSTRYEETSPLRVTSSPSARDRSSVSIGEHCVAQHADAFDFDFDFIARLEAHFRLTEVADAFGCAHKNYVTGVKRHRLRDVRDERRNVEDQIARIATLKPRSVETLGDAQVVCGAEIGHGNDAGEQGAECVESLSAKPLLVGELNLASTDVVGNRVTEDGR